MKITAFRVSLLLLAALVVAAGVGPVSAQSLYNQVPFATTSVATGVAPATPAATSVKASAGTLVGVSCFNLLATPVYVKLFNASSVTLGTTSAVMNLMCPGNTAGAGFAMLVGAVNFSTAIQYAVTGGISLTDNTGITATSVIVNISYQ